jgi:ABC-type transport system substrate-binding protein
MNTRNVIYILIVLALVIGSCARAPEVPPTTAPPADTPVVPPEQPTPEPPTERKLVRFIFTQEFDTLNPHYTNMWFSSITWQIWNVGAWDFDEENNPRPIMVTEIPSMDNGGISPDGNVITLTLRDDIVWSDGQPITSDDFAFTYEMIVDPNNTVASTYPYDLIENLETPDARTVVMTFDEPFRTLGWSHSGMFSSTRSRSASCFRGGRHDRQRSLESRANRQVLDRFIFS